MASSDGGDGRDKGWETSLVAARARGGGVYITQRIMSKTPTMTTATTTFMTIVRKVVGGMSSATPKYTFNRQSSPWRGAVTRRRYAQALCPSRSAGSADDQDLSHVHEVR